MKKPLIIAAIVIMCMHKEEPEISYDVMDDGRLLSWNEYNDFNFSEHSKGREKEIKIIYTRNPAECDTANYYCRFSYTYAKSPTVPKSGFYYLVELLPR